MMDMTYLTPEQRERDYLRELMVLTMKELAVQDNIQADLINAIIRVQLKRMNPFTALFADYEQIETIARRIVDVAEGACEVVLTDFDILKQVLLEQPGEVIRIGRAKKDEYFAVVDIDGAIAGVYVPKHPRQIIIEERVAEAIERLEDFLSQYGKKLWPEVRSALTSYLYHIEYPYHVPHIKIIASNHPLETNDIILLRGDRVIQFQYEQKDEKRALLQFYVFRNR